jgi:hypothetical protein
MIQQLANDNQKFKTAFEQYAFDNGYYVANDYGEIIAGFYEFKPSMQIGVLIRFFGSSEVQLLVEYSIYDRTIRIIDFYHDVEEQVHEFDMTYDFEESENLQGDYEEASITKAIQIFEARP